MNVGVARYAIAEQADTIDALWSTDQMAHAGTGVARGNTSNGFPGRYKVTYYNPDGSTLGIFELDIGEVQETFQLIWSNDEGQVLYTGVGIEDNKVLSAAYIKCDP